RRGADMLNWPTDDFQPHFTAENLRQILSDTLKQGQITPNTTAIAQLAKHLNFIRGVAAFHKYFEDKSDMPKEVRDAIHIMTKFFASRRLACLGYDGIDT